MGCVGSHNEDYLMKSVAKNSYLQRSFGSEQCKRFPETLRQHQAIESPQLHVPAQFCICEPEIDMDELSELSALFGAAFQKEKGEIRTALQGGVFSRVTSTGKKASYDFTHSFVAGLRLVRSN